MLSAGLSLGLVLGSALVFWDIRRDQRTLGLAFGRELSLGLALEGKMSLGLLALRARLVPFGTYRKQLRKAIRT